MHSTHTRLLRHTSRLLRLLPGCLGLELLRPHSPALSLRCLNRLRKERPAES
jgi:hypothetical protein